MDVKLFIDGYIALEILFYLYLSKHPNVYILTIDVASRYRSSFANVARLCIISVVTFAIVRCVKKLCIKFYLRKQGFLITLEFTLPIVG